MTDIDQTPRARVLSLPGPMVIDSVRMDTMVMGPDGDMVRPCLVVILTPAMMPGPFFSYRLPASVDESFRELAAAMHDVLGDEL